MSVVSFSAVGRRKKAIARVRLIPGEGNITINKRSLDEYFGLETLKTVVRQPLTLTETARHALTSSSASPAAAYTGQAGAIRHGISRALVKADEELKWHHPKSRRLPHPRPAHEGAQEIRPQSSSSRSAVQQALIGRKFTTQKLKNPGKSAFSGVFLYPFRPIAFEAFRCF